MDAGIVDQDVEPTEFFDHSADQAVNVVRIGHIAPTAQHLGPGFGGQAIGGRRGGFGVDVTENDHRTQAGQGPGRRLAQSACTAGHQGHSAGQVEQAHADSSRSASTGGWNISSV